MMIDNHEVDIVRRWHQSLNDGDLEALVALSSPEIEIGGPRGSARGSKVLGEWVERANIRMEVTRVFGRDGTIVVEEDAAWHDPASGEVIGRDLVGSVFVVECGRVASVHRYPNLEVALDAAGLGSDDEA